PKDYVGPVMELNNDRRGRFDHMEYLSPERVLLAYELPLAEIVLDYYDQLKSRTRGYASFDYDVAGFREGALARVDILIGDEPVDALSMIVHRDAAYSRGKALVERLRKERPRRQSRHGLLAASQAMPCAISTSTCRSARTAVGIAISSPSSGAAGSTPPTWTGCWPSSSSSVSCSRGSSRPSFSAAARRPLPSRGSSSACWRRCPARPRSRSRRTRTR